MKSHRLILHPTSPIQFPSFELKEAHTDLLGRQLRELRISVTDRCNFRCTYCMPKSVFHENYIFLDRENFLSFDEIVCIAKNLVKLGVEKIRLTGGEPLLRKNLECLIEKLAKLQTPAGQNLEIALTSNASLLTGKAQTLKDAGLTRVSVSLDALNDSTFKKMSDSEFTSEQVLAAIDTAHKAGFESIKINMVVKKGTNDQEILKMARHFKNTPHVLRFIEYMDVGNCNAWQIDDVVPSADIVQLVSSQVGALEAIRNPGDSTVAQRWRYQDGQGEIGVISSVTQPFCKDCSRMRLSTDGKLYTCLFATQGHGLKDLLRSGLQPDELDAQLQASVQQLWQLRSDRYSEKRTPQTPDSISRIEMSYIGG